MDLVAVLQAVLVLAGVCLLFGLLIATANARLRVDEDPRIDAVADMLPGSNCGACGYAGCRSFAEGVVGGSTTPAQCTQMTPEAIAGVADYLGVEAGSAVRRVARLLCMGGTHVARQQAEYRGLATCAAADVIAGGGKACAWGCLGLADCAEACDYEAIRMDEHGLPQVLPERCTACGDCVDACPRGLFEVMPVDRKLIVQCRSRLEGDEALAVCQVACNACGRCAQDAAAGVVSIVDGLAVVDQAQNERAGPEAVARCPTGAIAWVEGAQQVPAGAPQAGASR